MTETELLLCRKLKRDHTGREKAIPGAVLADYLSLSDTRQLRDVVEGLRREHEPIMSLSGIGYWWPKEWGEEESHCLRQLYDMGVQFMKAADCIEYGLIDQFGEPKLFSEV